MRNRIYCRLLNHIRYIYSRIQVELNNLYIVELTEHRDLYRLVWGSRCQPRIHILLGICLQLIRHRRYLHRYFYFNYNLLPGPEIFNIFLTDFKSALLVIASWIDIATLNPAISIS